MRDEQPQTRPGRALRWSRPRLAPEVEHHRGAATGDLLAHRTPGCRGRPYVTDPREGPRHVRADPVKRSEERRVGKERSNGRPPDSFTKEGRRVVDREAE